MVSVRAPSTGHGRLKQQGKAPLDGKAPVGLFVCTNLKWQQLLPSRVYAGKCSSLVEWKRKKKVSHLSHLYVASADLGQITLATSTIVASCGVPDVWPAGQVMSLFFVPIWKR